MDVRGAPKAAEPTLSRSQWGGVSAARPGVLALRGSRSSVPGIGREQGQSQQDSPAGLLPLLPCPGGQDQPHPCSLPAFPGGPCCPTQQGCVRRTRRRTSLLLYTNRAGIRTKCCPRQEGGRQTEREGDIREVTQNRLRLYGRKQAATTTVRGEDSAVPTGVLRARRTGTLPAVTTLPQSPAAGPDRSPPSPRSRSTLGSTHEAFVTQNCAGRGRGPKRRKEGKDRDTRVREEEREGGHHLCIRPPCPPLTLPTGSGSPCTGQEHSSPTLGLWDTAPRAPRPWSHGGSSGPNGTAITWQEDVDRGVTLGPRQAPALTTAAILQHVLDRGRAATWNQPRARPLSPQHGLRALTARVGRGLACEEAAQAPPAPLRFQECRSHWPGSQCQWATSSRAASWPKACPSLLSHTPSLSPLGAH